MARKQIVSRTVIGTEVTILGLNVETAEPQNVTYSLSGSFNKEVADPEHEGKTKVVTDEDKLLRYVKRNYDTDSFKNVKIVDVKPINKLYGMWEEDFIANAMELDPITRKPIAQNQQ